MNMLFWKCLIGQLVVALGCTEPIAIVLAFAVASKHLKEPLEFLEVYASGTSLKTPWVSASRHRENRDEPCGSAGGLWGMWTENLKFVWHL